MTKMQLKAIFMYGWYAYASALLKQEIYTTVSTQAMDAVFEDLVQRDYISALITEQDPE